MGESEYSFVDLTVSTGDATISIYEKTAKGNIASAAGYSRFMDHLELTEIKRASVPGAQRGFIVYQDDIPVGCLDISNPSLIDQDIVRQDLEGFMTDPEYRSLRLLHEIFGQIKRTQDPNYFYVYDAFAAVDTSYRGLKRPGVQSWLRENGYEVKFVAEDKEAAEGKEHREVFLYPNTNNAVLATK